MSAPRRRSNPQWAALAERAELVFVAGELKTDENGGLTGLFISAGPKFYVRRVHERFAAKNGFVVTSVRREPPPLVNPLTGELNTVYSVRLERRQ